jgi:hypothetical protein
LTSRFRGHSDAAPGDPLGRRSDHRRGAGCTHSFAMGTVQPSRTRPSAARAPWILAIELQGLIDLGFEVEATGFALGEIEVILDEAAEALPTIPWMASKMKFLPSATRRFRAAAMCGGWGVIGWCAAMLGTQGRTKRFSAMNAPTCSLPTLPTMSRSTATSVAWAAFVIGNSPWAPERCPRRNSRPF